jgi:hypothetical protein
VRAEIFVWKTSTAGTAVSGTAPEISLRCGFSNGKFRNPCAQKFWRKMWSTESMGGFGFFQKLHRTRNFCVAKMNSRGPVRVPRSQNFVDQWNQWKWECPVESLGGRIEKSAGLIHDIGPTAFSISPPRLEPRIQTRGIWPLDENTKRSETVELESAVKVFHTNISLRV